MTDIVPTQSQSCVCESPGYCKLLRRKNDPPLGRLMHQDRWEECRNQPAYFEMFLKESTDSPAVSSFPLKSLGEGPGTELKKLLEAEGIPSCSACLETARKMNELGPEKCIESLEELAEEILPRAREWVSQNYKWSKALPSFAKDPIIREQIRENIKKAVTNFRESQQRRSL